MKIKINRTLPESNFIQTEKNKKEADESIDNVGITHVNTSLSTRPMRTQASIKRKLFERSESARR